MLLFLTKLKNIYFNVLGSITIINDKSNTNNIDKSKRNRDVSINKVDDLDIEYNYDESICCKCVISKTNYIRHCARCDDCHDNRKTLYCELCNICINYISEIDIIMHRKRHNSLILSKNKRFGRHNSI